MDTATTTNTMVRNSGMSARAELRHARKVMPPEIFAKLVRHQKPTGCLLRGMPNRRIIRTEYRGDFRFELHATKGWRVKKA